MPVRWRASTSERTRSRTSAGDLNAIERRRFFTPVWSFRTAVTSCMALDETTPTQREGRESSGALRLDGWFALRKRVLPRDTDYAGVVWHGRYVDWLEEARVEFLAARGFTYEQLVRECQCETPVIQLSLSYKRPVRFGEVADVLLRVCPRQRTSVRIIFECRIVAAAATVVLPENEQTPVGTVYVDGRVELTIVDRNTGRVLRKLPPQLEKSLYG